MGEVVIMGANCDELKAFQKKLEKLNEAQKDEFFQACSKELAARLLAKVIKRTPVGQPPKINGAKTVKVQGESGKSKTMLTAEGARYEQYWASYQGGTLRRGWTAGENVNDFVNSIDIQHVGDKYIIEITNPVEYASYVEYGHRQTPKRYVPALGKRLKQGWIQGKFMLKISEEEIKNSQQKILQAKLNKFLKEVIEDD
jgi:hypothetical protein